MSSRDGLEKIGPGRWRARITWHDASGKRHDTERIIYANTRGEALRERERIREELAGGGDEWTVGEAIDAWLPTMRSGSRRTRTVHAKRFREKFGPLKLSAVKATEIQRWLAGLAASDDTANYHRASVSAMYKFARAQGRLRGDNPVDDTVNRHTERTNEEWLSELDAPEPRRALIGDEIATFFGALLEHEPDLYPIARCHLLLGCRWSEVAALQWRDIDWVTGIVTIRRAQDQVGELGPPKGKKRRSSAVGPEGLAFLRGHRAAMEAAGWPGSDVWCFPRKPSKRARRYDTWPYGTIQPKIKALRDALGIGIVSNTHAFRHTHITLARALEADHALQASVGHSDAKTTEVYTDESHRQAVAQSFASKLESRIGGAAAGADVLAMKPRRK